MGTNVPACPHKHYVGEVDLNDVKAARELLEGITEVTPMAHSRWLSSKTSTQVYLKAENLQRAGSFKIRGAYVRISRPSHGLVVRDLEAVVSQIEIDVALLFQTCHMPQPGGNRQRTSMRQWRRGA